MKKIISMLLALMLICTFCTPAFAEDVFADTPRILNNTQQVLPENSEMAKKGSDDNGVDDTEIPQEAQEGVIRDIGTDSTNDVRGMDKLKQAECPHANGFTNGECNDCGSECAHTNGFVNGKCKDCGLECLHRHVKTVCDDCGTEIENTSTASTLSNGYPEIVFGIGGIAIGVVATLLFSRKKKVAVSCTAAEDEE